MILRLILIFSLFMLSLTAHGQLEIPNDSIRKHQIFVSADISGVTVLPLVANFTKDVQSHQRLLGKFQYLWHEKIALDIVYGQDRFRSNIEIDNFVLNEFNAEYVQLHLKLLPYNQKKARLFVGGGFIYGNLREVGVIEKTNDDFHTYEQSIKLNETFNGWIASVALDYKLNTRWSLVLDTKLQGVLVNNDTEVPVIYSNPGGGKVWFPFKKSAIGFHRTLLLKYRLF